MTTVSTRTTPKNSSKVRSDRRARTFIGASVAALTAFAPVAGVVDAAPTTFLQQEGGDTAAGTTTELGDRNELAAWWQDRLNEWLQLSGSDLYPIAVDGWYGPNTQEATISFQEATETVEADGVVNPEDRVALREAIQELEDGAAPVELGDRNELAAWWQDRLNEWLQLSGSDLYPIVVDGWYGPNTQEATIAFQEATETVDADGVVNPEDRVALREAIDALVGETDDGTDGGSEGFGTAAVTSDDFPASGETSLLQDVRVEEATDQEATDRLVFEFGSDTGDVSYEVEYSDTVVDTAGTAVEVEGEATLAVTITPASAVDLSGDEAAPTYTGPDRFSPDTASAVTELALAEDFEATMTWAVGVDEERPFRVQVMENPLRLVVDVRAR